MSVMGRDFKHIVWTQGMRRLAVLVGRALEFGEPVLLVGETGYDTVCLQYCNIHRVECTKIDQASVLSWSALKSLSWLTRNCYFFTIPF